MENKEKIEKRIHFFLFLFVFLAGLGNGIYFFVSVAVRLSAVSFSAVKEQLVLGMICFLAAVMTGISYYRYWKGKFGRIYVVVTIASGLGNILVVFCTLFWILWGLGIQFLPPPQR